MGKYLRTDNLAVGYSGKALIENICLEINKGEIVSLIGPNGAGKSTILKTLTKQLASIHGTVELGNSNIEKIKYKELSSVMAVVLTERIRSELMTCRDIVAMGRYPYTGRMGLLSQEDEKKVDEVMELFQIENLADKDFMNISDGQKQRVLIAKALCQEPEIIVLDEPTSFLDIKYKVELLSILRKIAREKNTTIVMSLHEIDLAQKISDKVICVKGDRIFKYGEPKDIFTTEIISSLYDIAQGTYNINFGSIEFPINLDKEPEVFVIAGGGSGKEVFRSLQQSGTAFYAGIIPENDIDYEIGKSLASKIITSKQYCSISHSEYEEALDLIKTCKKVIICPVQRGEINIRLFELIEEIKNDNTLEKVII